MNRRKQMLGTIGLAAGAAAMALGAAGALAASNFTAPPGYTVCTPTGPGCPSEPIGNVTVPNGASLYLDGATILGNVTVQPGGALDLLNSHVSGGLTSTGAGAGFGGQVSGIQLCGNTFGSSVSVSNTNPNYAVQIGDPDHYGCLGNHISGSLSVKGNQYVDVEGNTVGGSVTFNNNRYSAGTNSGGEDLGNTNNYPELSGNSVSGSISCSGNRGVGTTMGVFADMPNSASAKLGQCAFL